MKQINDHSLFVPEFQKLIDSHEYVNMQIDEIDHGMVIRLEKSNNTDQRAKKARRMRMLEKTAGILKNAPDSVKKEFQAIAERDGEDDREGSCL
ncbi:hypothetical protein [Paenibacillus sp. 1P07SE]|uniref:hypothetical protein n=1 Tax=Paenibacillus sp. 1P07SE TaxID=3132209 RepID=UPI0039A571A9